MNQHARRSGRNLLVALVCHVLFPACDVSADQPQWGRAWTRNMVADATGLIEDFDPATGRNLKWVVPLGTETWATPIVAQGRVFIGTNNRPPRDPRHRGDRALLLCLDENDGRLLWQSVVPKLGPDPYLDWPGSGFCSPVTVEGDRVYVVNNRGEAMCLDIEGQRNGNQGPFLDEGRHMVPEGEPPIEVAETDGDIIWLFDIHKETGTYPHDGAHSSILIDGDFLYMNTGNGVDNTHRVIRRPDGPSLIVLDKHTGRYLARDDERIGPRIFHCTWSSPSMGVVNGRKQIFFGGGDGVLYAFEPLETARGGRPALANEEQGQDALATGTVATLKRIWRFDPDPAAPKENVSDYLRNREVSPSVIKGMPVFHENRLYFTYGGDIWWGKRQAWLACIDATKTGDLTDSALVWSYELNEQSCSTPAIHDGLAFIVDCGRTIHCVDVATGQALWTHETQGEIWASPLVADGKLYIGTKRRDFWILAAGREKKVLSETRLDSPISASPIAANGVVYVATMRNLYALQASP
jgi:outer membrane protein assembly factor BamB